MHILASGPELQAVRFGYVISGENLKKGRILKRHGKQVESMASRREMLNEILD